MRRFVLGFATAMLGSVAALAEITIAPAEGMYYLDGTQVFASRSAPPNGSTYGVFTGVATPTGGLTLVEPTAPPIRTDIRTTNYGGAGTLINDYIAAAGSVQRTVSESTTGGPGAYSVSYRVDGSGELFPAGFVNGAGVALTSAGFGLGLNLPAALGGADPVNWQAGDTITSATLEILDASGGQLLGGPFALPVATFFPTNPNWNGVFGVSLGNATGLGARSVILTLSAVPEPATLGMLVLGGLALLRRR